MKNDKYVFKTESEREVAVCIAIQKTGLASIEDIIKKIESWGGRITEKQTTKIAENLRRRDILSIDLTKKDNGISLKRYAMKKIKLALPEVAQIKDITDNEDVKPLIEELDRSKKIKKKGLKTFDYYVVRIDLKPRNNLCDVEGFMPDEKGVIKHYRDNKDNIIFQPKHFQNWFRANLPFINRVSSAIGDIGFNFGSIQLNGQKTTHLKERYVTNIESGFSSSRGTGGRGSVKVECLPHDCIITTEITIPRELIPPEKVEEAIRTICDRGKAFGGCHKLSTGFLSLDKLEIVDNMIWNDN